MERLVGIADRARAWPVWARLGGAALPLGAAIAARFALIAAAVLSPATCGGRAAARCGGASVDHPGAG